MRVKILILILLLSFNLAGAVLIDNPDLPLVRTETEETGGGIEVNNTGNVTSVSNTDGTLSIAPIIGDVIASVNLAHPFIWTANHVIQKSSPQFTLDGSGADLRFLCTSTACLFGTTTSDNLQFQTGSSSRLIINGSNGHVGIGIAPEHFLDINNGNVLLRSGKFFFEEVFTYIENVGGGKIDINATNVSIDSIKNCAFVKTLIDGTLQCATSTPTAVNFTNVAFVNQSNDYVENTLQNFSDVLIEGEFNGSRQVFNCGVETRTGSDYWEGPGNALMSGTNGYVMPRRGSFKAVGVSFDFAATQNGTLRYITRKNGVNVAPLLLDFTLTTSSTVAQNNYTTIARYDEGFTAGDTIQCASAHLGGLVGRLDDGFGWFEVQYD